MIRDGTYSLDSVFLTCTLYDVMLIIKVRWLILGNQDNPTDNFDEMIENYSELREETNYLFAYLIVTIGSLE